MSQPTKPRFVTVKEIAAKLELSCDTVIRHERRLGLHQCRDKVCRKPRRYFTTDVERIMAEHGHVVVF